MTILAHTAAHLVEYEAGQLTIARYADGHCIAFEGVGIAGAFRAALRGRDPAYVVAVYIRAAGGDRADWHPLYKPQRMPRPGTEARP